jgi:hypothetical protein
MTLHEIEKGDAGVYMGNYAAVLFALGLVDRISDLADPTHDTIGRELEEEHLPQRVRLSSRKKQENPKAGDR